LDSQDLIITYLGHAGLYIKTGKTSILCDPWFNPAYMGSWFVFPDNSDILNDEICNPEYLYLSHLHQDHFDNRFLAEHVAKSTQVLLPDFPTKDYEERLRQLGFKNFVRTSNGKTLLLNEKVSVAIHSFISPADGPLGDSTLIVASDDLTVLNQNDARPTDITIYEEFKPFTAHFLQFSGAIWYPMVYRLSSEEKRRIAKVKRANQLERALRYVTLIGAKAIYPIAGPPCFLDDDLFSYNDFGDETNILPGDEISTQTGDIKRKFPEKMSAYDDKLNYLLDYKDKSAKIIDSIKESWQTPDYGVYDCAKSWMQPIIEKTDQIARGINARLLLESPNNQIVLDFLDKRVKEFDGELCRYKFYFPDRVLEHLIYNQIDDWVNYVFLSLRFEAERDGPYNEYVYSFFKALSADKIKYVETYYETKPPIKELINCGGYLVQRQCPHMRADLTKFGVLNGNVLTCGMHGWQFDIKSGKCLTSDDRHLYSIPKNSATNLPVTGEIGESD
jgi:UDP-MurNAc hydroxylase